MNFFADNSQRARTRSDFCLRVAVSGEFATLGVILRPRWRPQLSPTAVGVSRSLLRTFLYSGLCAFVFQMVNGDANGAVTAAAPTSATGPSKSTRAKRRARGTTSRTVTLQMLLDTNILEPGDSVLSLEYMVTGPGPLVFANHAREKQIRLLFSAFFNATFAVVLIGRLMIRSVLRLRFNGA